LEKGNTLFSGIIHHLEFVFVKLLIASSGVLAKTDPEKV